MAQYWLVVCPWFRLLDKLSAPFQPSCLPLDEWVNCSLHWSFFFYFIYIVYLWFLRRGKISWYMKDPVFKKCKNSSSRLYKREILKLCYAVFGNPWNGMFNQENVYSKKEILKLSTQKSRLFRQVALFEYPVNKFIISL